MQTYAYIYGSMRVRGRMEILFGAGYLFASTFYVYHLTHVLQAAGQPQVDLWTFAFSAFSQRLKTLSLRIGTCVLARRRCTLHGMYLFIANKYYGCKIKCRNFKYNPKVEKWEKNYWCENENEQKSKKLYTI